MWEPYILDYKVPTDRNMKVFITYDDIPMKHESFLAVKSLSVVPESERDFYDGDIVETYEIYKVILLQNNKSIVRHNVQSLEVV